MNRSARIAAVVIVVLIVEGFVVAAALVSPDFRETAAEASSGAIEALSDTWIGSDDEPGYGPILGRAIVDTYQQWLVPLWSARPDSERDKQVFAACATCHLAFADRQRFGDLYMDHPLHASTGLGCGDCHTDVVHPGPLPPAESICEGCHADDVTTGGDCSLCHASGSLPHYSFLGAPRTGLVLCTTCHLPDSIGVGDHHFNDLRPDFDGTDRGECLGCHQESTCQQCHDVDHPDDWSETHPSGVGPRGPGMCTTCHSVYWCSDACHAAAGLSIPLKPLPISPTGGNQ